MKKKQSIKDRVFHCIVVHPNRTLGNIVQVTKLTKKQVSNAIQALKHSDSFPADSKWAQRTSKEPTLDEVRQVKGIGIVKVKKIIKFLEEL